MHKLPAVKKWDELAKQWSKLLNFFGGRLGVSIVVICAIAAACGYQVKIGPWFQFEPARSLTALNPDQE